MQLVPVIPSSARSPWHSIAQSHLGPVACHCHKELQSGGGGGLVTEPRIEANGKHRESEREERQRKQQIARAVGGGGQQVKARKERKAQRPKWKWKWRMCSDCCRRPGCTQIMRFSELCNCRGRCRGNTITDSSFHHILFALDSGHLQKLRFLGIEMNYLTASSFELLGRTIVAWCALCFPRSRTVTIAWTMGRLSESSQLRCTTSACGVSTLSSKSISMMTCAITNLGEYLPRPARLKAAQMSTVITVLSQITRPRESKSQER